MWKFDRNGVLEYAGIALSWELLAGDLKNPPITLTPESMDTFQLIKKTPGECTAQWHGHQVCGKDFTVTIQWKCRADKRLEGTLKFAGNSSGLFIETVHFPTARMAFPADGVRILVGVSQGWVYRFDADHADGDLAKHHYSSLQMCAALLGGEGIYFDCRDNNYMLKGYSWQKHGTTLEYRGVHPLPCAPRNRKAGRLSYVSSIQRFAGDWFEAGQIYRKWALRARYYRNRIRNNAMRDIAVWLWNRGSAEHVIPPAEKLAADSGVPVALDWYWWHSNPYDTDYPNFWPPREGEETFRKAIARLNRQGIYTQVYVNGLTWDIDLPDFAEQGAQDVVIDRDGKPHAVEFNCYTHRKLGYMCGEAPIFQKRMLELVGKLADCGLPGVYLDMIGCATIHPCYNPKHRHAPGGGNYHAHGYRNMVAKIRQNHPELHLSTECCNENFLDIFDSVIVLASSMERCGSQEWLDCVPLFSAVYHGATAMFGNYALPDGIPPWDPLWPERERWKNEQNWDEVYPDQFYLEMARTVIWGMQPTVCNFQLCHTQGRFKEMYRFLVELVKFYYQNRDFLYDGRLLAPGDFECKTEKFGFLQRGLFTTEEKHTILFKELPVILHSRWEAPDGRQALVMINFTAHPQKCIADGTEYQMPARSCKIIITP
jgi:hypothetical protein